MASPANSADHGTREERLSVALPGMFLVRGRLVRTLQIISAREWSGIDAKDLMRSGALSSLCLHAGIGNNGRDGATECWLVKAISPRVLFTLSNRPYFFSLFLIYYYSSTTNLPVLRLESAQAQSMNKRYTSRKVKNLLMGQAGRPERILYSAGTAQSISSDERRQENYRPNKRPIL